MAEVNRSTVLAVTVESTENVAVVPAGATEYVALQNDLDVESGVESLESDELRGSLAPGKPILGVENPSVSFSHYLKHSGTEGQEPEMKQILKALFGSSNANSTQRTTTTGSTTSVVNLAAGGADFARGRAVLIKDGTNGYSIRPVHSVATNNLTLGFNVGSAPATGINVGKCVSYEPANSGHQSLSVWAYRANRGAIEMISGARVTGMDMSAPAGGKINLGFSMSGSKYHYNPIVTTSSTRYLDFLDDAATRVITVSAKAWKSPHELAAAIQTAMNGLGSANTFTCVYSDTTGKFTITSDGTTLTLKWSTGANTANTIATKIGFSAAADSSGALTYTSATAQTLTSPYTPTLDSTDFLVAKNMEVLMGDATDTTSLSASNVSINVADEPTPLGDISAESGRSGQLIQRRTCTVGVTSYLTQYDVSKFKRFMNGTETRFAFNFGEKSGGNWVAGKCGCFYIPTATISKFKVTEANGILVIEMELQAYADSSGNGEVYLNFL